MSVNVNLIVVCGFAGCPWSMEIDRSSGADPMAVHAAYLDHLDDHDLADEQVECEAADHWVSVAQALAEECPSCKAEPGQPHTEYCRLPKWAAHDAEVAWALAEDRIPGGGIYAGQLYAGDTPVHEGIGPDSTVHHPLYPELGEGRVVRISRGVPPAALVAWSTGQTSTHSVRVLVTGG